MSAPVPPRTLVFVHAHPDDEALLTAGTMARAAAEGHRVVLVVATDGEAGLASPSLRAAGDLGERRRRELAVSAAALGVARTVHLGFADSGLDGLASDGFAAQPVDAVAARVAEVLADEDADVVVGYDPAGGYGHPDHLMVHRAVRLAVQSRAAQPRAAQPRAAQPRAAEERVPRLFEATLPREPIARTVAAAAALRLTPRDFDPATFAAAWTPRGRITHRVDVRRWLAAKRAALAAHASQSQTDGTTRTLGVLGRLPGPIFAALLGTEFYVAVP